MKKWWQNTNQYFEFYFHKMRDHSLWFVKTFTITKDCSAYNMKFGEVWMIFVCVCDCELYSWSQHLQNSSQQKYPFWHFKESPHCNHRLTTLYDDCIKERINEKVKEMVILCGKTKNDKKKFWSEIWCLVGDLTATGIPTHRYQNTGTGTPATGGGGGNNMSTREEQQNCNSLQHFEYTEKLVDVSDILYMVSQLTAICGLVKTTTCSTPNKIIENKSNQLHFHCATCNMQYSLLFRHSAPLREQREWWQ